MIPFRGKICHGFTADHASCLLSGKFRLNPLQDICQNRGAILRRSTAVTVVFSIDVCDVSGIIRQEKISLHPQSRIVGYFNNFTRKDCYSIF